MMKPGDIAVGARDLLSILVPGALLLLLIPQDIALRMIGSPIVAGESLQEALLFLTGAYAAGALIGAIAGLFDPLAERAYRPLSSYWPSKRGLQKTEEDQFKSLRATARELERRLLDRSSIALGETTLWNDKAFWRNYLRIASPAAIAELDRAEGQQKLFRSLSLVFLLISMFYALTLLGVVLLVTAILFFLLYVSYRRRFNARLYQLGIAYFAHCNEERLPKLLA